MDTKELTSDVYNEKDKKELVDRFNEYNRKKEVYEDYNFDANDTAQI